MINVNTYRARFVAAYCEAMLWANTYGYDGPDSEPEQVEPAWWQCPSATWQLEAFDANSQESILTDCESFLIMSWRDLRTLDAEQAGHDFALTRNHHGVGFWDRGLGELGDRLTKDAQSFGNPDGWCDTSDDATDTLVHLN